MRKLHYLIFLLILASGLRGELFAQTDSIARSVNTVVPDSISVDPLKISEAGYVSERKKILSVHAAGKLLKHAEELHDSNAEALASLSLGDAFIAHGNNKKALESLDHSLRLKDSLNDDKAISHLYYDLAIVFAHLKQYPLALQCFYKTGYVYQQTFFKRKRKRIFSIDTTADARMADLYNINSIEDSSTATIFSDTNIDSLIMHTDTAKLNNNPLAEDSPFTEYAAVTDAFYDNKPATAFGILIHIKQPTPGKDNIFEKFSKVGHTFVTLTKFNSDSSIVSKTFGFYPEKDNLLSATPIMPSTNSVFKDDALHDWDELVGKFISQKQFIAILDFIEETGSKRYNLNSNNCTDFGLHIASIAKIEVQDTRGYWPLGRGNNPASTGQSILKGKFKNLDNNSQHGLFACSNNLFIRRNATQ